MYVIVYKSNNHAVQGVPVFDDFEEAQEILAGADNPDEFEIVELGDETEGA